jgi:hypothetical protein
VKIYEFAVEFGFNFRYIEVTNYTEKAARRELWDKVLTVDEKDAVSSVELTSVRDAEVA